MDSFGALRTLEEQRLRVGRIHTLNDPFECFPGLIGINEEGASMADHLMRRFVEVLSEETGVICFSGSATEPVLWSHYADHHRGIALEFEITDDPQKRLKIEYSDERPSMDYSSIYSDWGKDYFEPIFRTLVSRKSRGWAYEDEHRLYERLADCAIGNGHYYRPIPKESLRRVIIGWRSSIETSYVERVLARNKWAHCVVTRAKAVAGSFLIDYDTSEGEFSPDAVKLGDDD